MNTFSVALLQLLPTDTADGNLQKGIDACKRAKAMGADLALFPEVWSNGYNLPDSADEMRKAAIPRDGVFLNTYKTLAKELDMAIAVTYLEQFSPLPRNTVTVFDRFGKEALTYSKVHTCDFWVEKHLTPGDDFYTATLNTAAGDIRIGAMICYDREFPESARILMLKGAEILLIPNACPLEQNRLMQLRTRAFENMVGVAVTNYPYGKPDCNGHSAAYDGIAYGEIRPDTVESRDTLIVEAGEQEGIYMAVFPMDKLRDYRNREAWGNAYRHPQKYKLLTEERTEPPFVREDYRK